MHDIRLVVFDLDGTLVDSSTDLANAVNALLAELDVSGLPDRQIVSMVGEGAAVLVGRALTASGLDPQTPGALDRFLAHYNAHLLDHTRPYAGMVQTLQVLTAQGLPPIAFVPGFLDERALEVGQALSHAERHRSGGGAYCLNTPSRAPGVPRARRARAR